MPAMPQLPITYQSSKLKMLALFAGSVTFVALGIWIYPKSPVVSLLASSFFGLCGVIALANMHPRSSYLTLTEKGFEFASLFRRHFVAWPDVAGFRPVNVVTNRMVGWNYVAGFNASRTMRSLSASIVNVEAALPDSYGHSCDELARLMNELREEFGGTRRDGV